MCPRATGRISDVDTLSRGTFCIGRQLTRTRRHRLSPYNTLATFVDCRKGKANGKEVSCNLVVWPMYAFVRQDAHLKTN